MERYDIQKVVGQGSYGRAILCKRKKDAKLCIIKQISLAKLSKREAKLTEQEAQLLGKLSHPNIVAFWESFVKNSSLHIVMEFADGGDLDSYIKTYQKKHMGREMPESQVLNLFVQICLAMKHIHDRKILHRDLKGQNIFLTSSGLCKVGDFGVSRVLRSTIELAATQIGTPYYMSPEIMNNQKYNSKTDIWSLGVILYELVCLRLPFQGNSMKQLCYNIIHGQPLPPPSSFSREMKELLRDILAKDPRKRPSINNILSRSLIKDRIQNFLNETKIHREFSHTILHGVNVLNAPSAAVLQPPISQPTPVIASKPSVPQAPKPIAAHSPPVVVNPKHQNPPAVAVQPPVHQSAAAAMAKYRVMGHNPTPAAPPAKPASNIAFAKPAATPVSAPPKTVDQIIREILQRDRQQPRRKPAVPIAQPAVRNQNIVRAAVPAPQKYQPKPAEVPSAQAKVPAPMRVDRPRSAASAAKPVNVPSSQQPNPFQAIVGGRGIPIAKHPYSEVDRKVGVVYRPNSQPAANKPREVVRHHAEVAMPRPVVSNAIKPKVVAEVAPRNPSVKAAENNNEPQVGKDEEKVEYRSPKIALQKRAVEGAHRVEQIDAIIGKAAAVLDMIKQEKLKSNQVKADRQSEAVREKEDSAAVKKIPIPVAGARVLAPTPPITSEAMTPPSSGNSNNNTPKADLPWLQNLQHQMGALKVQVQKLQDDKQFSPVPTPPISEDFNSIAANQKVESKNDDLSKKGPSGSNKGGSVSDKSRPPVVPNSRQSYPFEKNPKRAYKVMDDNNNRNQDRVQNSGSPAAVAGGKPPGRVSRSISPKPPVSMVHQAKGNNNPKKAGPPKGIGMTPKPGPSKEKNLKVVVKKKPVEPEGPTSKEVLEQRKERRKQHRQGFHEFLKAQRAAKKESSGGSKSEGEEEDNHDDYEEEDYDDDPNLVHEEEEGGEDYIEDNKIVSVDDEEDEEIDQVSSSLDLPESSHYAHPIKKANPISSLSSGSFDNPEVVSIMTAPKQRGSGVVNRSSSQEDTSPRVTPSVGKKGASSKFLQNPNFLRSTPTNALNTNNTPSGTPAVTSSSRGQPVQVLIDDNIEILSPPKPIPPISSQQITSSPALSSSRSQYHIPDHVTNSQNYYKQPKPLPPSSSQSPIITTEEANDACCGKVFSNIFRSNSHNHNNVISQPNISTSNAKIVPTSPVRARNMMFEFKEETEASITTVPSATSIVNPQDSIPDVESEEVITHDNTDIPEERIETQQQDDSNKDDNEEEEEDDLSLQEKILLQHPLLDNVDPSLFPSSNLIEDQFEIIHDPPTNSEVPSIANDSLSDDFLGKSFVLEVLERQREIQQSEVESQNQMIDEVAALEYSLMLQQMQEILQLPTKKPSFRVTKANLQISPRSLEVVQEGEENAEEEEGEAEDDDDCFEEQSFTFHISDSEEEEGHENEEQLIESDFEIEESESEPLKDPVITKSSTTTSLHYSQTIVKPKSSKQSQKEIAVAKEGVVEEETEEIATTNDDFHETISMDENNQIRYYYRDYHSRHPSNDYQSWIIESQELQDRLQDLLGIEIFQSGMSFLSSNEMIDESLDEEEILMKLETILGVENLTYLEEMYQLLTYRQQIQEYEDQVEMVTSAVDVTSTVMEVEEI